MNILRIAIDGPAGAGKSTVARLLASKMGIVYVDTGAMFRTIALYFLEKGISPEEETKISDMLADISVEAQYHAGVQHMILCGRDVTQKIRTKDVTSAASVISQYPPVRDKVLELERKLAHSQSVVMDGRDIGTVVLPDAEIKIFLTADLKERALRRYRELEQSGDTAGKSPKEIEGDIRERDIRDSSRRTAPLKIAPDAVVIDCTFLGPDETGDKIIDLIRKKS